jgi:flagellar assembly factor FliW
MIYYDSMALSGQAPAPGLIPSMSPSGDNVPTPAANVVRFPAGLPGFETCHAFVLMAPAGNGPLQCLNAVDGQRASFLVIDPRRVLPDYRCELSAADRHCLGSSNDQALLWLALVSVEIDGTVTANLRAPVVINPVRMTGRQIVPQSSIYPLRHVILGAE